MGKYSTPRVPIQTKVFDDLENQQLSRTWIIFLERLGRETSAGSTGPFQRTLLLKDASVGDNIADVVPTFVSGTAVRLIGVLRNAITEDLGVRVRYKKVGEAIADLITITIPSSTAINTPVEETAFLATGLDDLVCLLWDVTESDGQVDAAGVASFTLQWA